METAGQKLLTIAVPTYNRPAKLLRLIDLLCNQIREEGLEDKVAVLISDNANSADVASSLDPFLNKEIYIKYKGQVKNLGADGNYRFLYENADSSYVWLMSDDDFPLPGAIRRVVETLESTTPDVLLFCFAQPPGSTDLQFKYPEPVHLIHDAHEAIRAVTHLVKLSIYVLKRVEWSDKQILLLNDSLGDGWMFVMLALTVLENSRQVNVAVISEMLATSDGDYTHIWVPAPILRFYKVGLHPYVRVWLPEMKEETRVSSYLQAIIFSWALVRKKLTLDDKPGLYKFISSLEWKWDILLKNPKQLLQLIVMKSGFSTLVFGRI